MPKAIAPLLALLLPLVLPAEESPDRVWRDLVLDPATSASRPAPHLPRSHRTLDLDRPRLRSLLAAAPRRGSVNAEAAAVVIHLPLPEGGYVGFRVLEVPIMAEALARKFPGIRTFRGESIDDRPASVRFDDNPNGFHAMIRTPRGTVFVDPWSRAASDRYLAYYRQDYDSALDAEWSCRTRDPARLSNRRSAVSYRAAVPVVRRTYRLALAATGEYTAFHGGTKSLAMAEMVTAIHRVNGIYESDFAVELNLVGDNDLIIYTDATSDPYTNGDDAVMLFENQTNLDQVIGIGNYDVGHVFGTGGGGIAGLGVVCWDSFVGLPGSGRAGFGVTGLGSPIGDPFYVDYVAHEIGHQFGAHHTFNGSTDSCAGNRNAASAYEPGSGSTIMAYAGICGAENLQPNSDPYFHHGSLEQMTSYIANTGPGFGGECASSAATPNLAPSVSAGAAYTIPAHTPFELTGSATDANADPLTYVWEQADLGSPSDATTVGVDDGSRPLFRSLLPSLSPSRSFPSMENVLESTTTIGETLPATDRTFTFVLVARDHNGEGGGTGADETSVTVVSAAGPFRIDFPNTAVSWGDGMQTVLWDVAQTDLPPISCLEVDLLLSTDGGGSFPILLASATPNDGSHSFAAPAAETAAARLMIRCSDNVFFDVNDGDFTIDAAGATIFSDSFESGDTSAWSATIP